MVQAPKELVEYFSEFGIALNQDRVLNFIELIKGIDDSTRLLQEEIYTSGDCGRFHTILKAVFPEAEAYVFKGKYSIHVLTKIDGKFYDAKGICTFERFKNNNTFKEALEGKFSLNEALEKVNLNFLLEEDLFNNYCFEVRGPIL